MSKKTTAVHTQTINLTAVEKKQLKKDSAGVIINLIKQQRSLYSKGIADWLAARQSAGMIDFPNRSRLYDIYDDMMLDDFIHGLIYNHRILPVTNRANKIVSKDGKKDDNKSVLFQERWFDETLKFMLESIFFGHSLIFLKNLQPGQALTNEVELIDRRHVLPELSYIKSWESDFTGQKYDEPPVSHHVLSVGNKTDLGLLNKAVPLWIIKKHGWQNWDEFAERFGIPIVAVKTASQDPRVIAEIEDWARELSTGAYGVFPDDTQIDIKENSKTDAFKVFAEQIRMAQEGLAVLFVGQTMTSMDGSSRSQAEVHQDVAIEIRKGDEKFLRYEIGILINKLATFHVWPLELTDRFEWDVPEDVKSLLEVFKVVNEMGFQLNAEEVSTRLGIKIDGLKAPIEVAPDPKKDKEKDKKELSVSEILNLHAGIARLHNQAEHV